MEKAWIVLSERHGYAFPARWAGIYPATRCSKEEAEIDLSEDEWAEEVEILPDGYLQRQNGEIIAHWEGILPTKTK